MISYEAYQDQEVIIKASVEVNSFKPSEGWRLGRGPGRQPEQPVRIWEIELDPEDFKGYNPFCAVNILHDRLFIEYDKTDMTPEPFLSYIKVKGLTLAHAATGAPVPQRGSLSCYRGHHWIIEDCTIDWSNGTGIDVGNECWHHTRIEGQILGSTIIRRNTIKNVGVCAIAGMFVSNMLIEDNLIVGTGWQRMELSWEAGAIKFHHSVNSLIRRNVIRDSHGCDAIWLDVANENNRITANLLLDGLDSREHIFMECTRDVENMIDNNIIWNVEGRFDRDSLPQEPGSSGWYKKTDLGIKNGYGIYAEGTDRLRIANNLIGKCHKAGFFAKAVAFRIDRKRGGTSRENKFFNNIFYDCGDAAIIMHNEHNEAEGNVYSKMPGGYLRLKYPEPEMCLDLATWQEFCGFDKTGATADLTIEVDREKLTMLVEVHDGLPVVARDAKVSTDYFSQAVEEESGVPGPFSKLKKGKHLFNIDPRKI